MNNVESKFFKKRHDTISIKTKRRNKSSTLNDNNLSSTKNDSLNLNSLKSKNKDNLKKSEKEIKIINDNFIKAKNLISDKENKNDLNISEFSYTNMNLSKDENIDKYIQCPIKKSFILRDNQLVKLNRINHDYKGSINLPYNMNISLPKIIEDNEEDDILNNKDNINDLDDNKKTENVLDDLDQVIQIDISNNSSVRLDSIKNNKIDSNIKEQTTNIKCDMLVRNSSTNSIIIKSNLNKNSIINTNTNYNIINISRSNINITNSSQFIQLNTSKINNLNVDNKHNLIKRMDSKFNKKFLFMDNLEITNGIEYKMKNNETIKQNQVISDAISSNTENFNSIDNKKESSIFINNFQLYDKNEDKISKNNSNLFTKENNNAYSFSDCNTSCNNVNRNLLGKFNICSNSNDPSNNYFNNNIEASKTLSNTQINKNTIEASVRIVDENKPYSNYNTNSFLYSNIYSNINSNENVNNLKSIEESNRQSLNITITPIKSEKQNMFYKTPSSKKKEFSLNPVENNIYNEDQIKNFINKSDSMFKKVSNSKNKNHQSKKYNNINNENIQKQNTNRKLFTFNKISFDLSLNTSGNKLIYSSNKIETSLSVHSCEPENKLTYRSNNLHTDPSVFTLDFYNNLLSFELNIKNKIPSNYLDNPNNTFITKELRTIVIDWIMKLCDELAFKRDTFYYAVNYLDRYFSKAISKIKKNDIQIIGICCLELASKIEEIQIPKLSEYLNCNNNDENTNSNEAKDYMITIEKITTMEINILSKLNWRVIPITLNTWMNWYICQWDLFIDNVDYIKESLLNYLNENDILYFKKTNDFSYYNYRKINQIVDLIIMDYNHLKYDNRNLIIGAIYIILCSNYNLYFDYYKKKFISRQKNKNNSNYVNEIEYIVFNVFSMFVFQSFNTNIIDDILVMECMKYCEKFLEFEFKFDLPLYYQNEDKEFNNEIYEDFISYQVYNGNMINYIHVLNEQESNV